MQQTDNRWTTKEHNASAACLWWRYKNNKKGSLNMCYSWLSHCLVSCFISKCIVIHISGFNLVCICTHYCPTQPRFDWLDQIEIGTSLRIGIYNNSPRPLPNWPLQGSLLQSSSSYNSLSHTYNTQLFPVHGKLFNRQTQVNCLTHYGKRTMIEDFNYVVILGLIATCKWLMVMMTMSHDTAATVWRHIVCKDTTWQSGWECCIARTNN